MKRKQELSKFYLTKEDVPFLVHEIKKHKLFELNMNDENFLNKIKRKIDYESLTTRLNDLTISKQFNTSLIKYAYTPHQLKKPYEYELIHLQKYQDQPCTFLDVFTDLQLNTLKELNDFYITFKIICETMNRTMFYKIFSQDIDRHIISICSRVIQCAKKIMCSPFSDPFTLHFISRLGTVVCREKSELVFCYSLALVKDILINNKPLTIYKFASFLPNIKFRKTLRPLKIETKSQKSNISYEKVKCADYIFSKMYHMLKVIDEDFNKP